MRRIVQTVAVLALIFFGSTFGGMLAESRRTLASRDGSGNYTLPVNSVNPAVAGQPIKSADFNATMNDLKTEMTDSLSRSAKGAMLGALRLNAGASASAPDLAWGAETNSGLWRSASNVFRFSVAGTDKTWWNATGFGVGLAPGFPIDVSYSNAAGGTAETALKLTNTQTANSTQIWFNGNRSWSLMAVGSAGAPAGGFSLTDNTSGKKVWSATSSDGFIIGDTGTAISASYRATATWNPGTLAACGAGPCATATTNITVTGAATGADCIAGVVNPAPLSGYPVQCIITSTNTCGLMIVNQSNTSVTFGSATFYCRVFNP